MRKRRESPHSPAYRSNITRSERFYNDSQGSSTAIDPSVFQTRSDHLFNISRNHIEQDIILFTSIIGGPKWFLVWYSGKAKRIYGKLRYPCVNQELAALTGISRSIEMSKFGTISKDYLEKLSAGSAEEQQIASCLELQYSWHFFLQQLAKLPSRKTISIYTVLMVAFRTRFLACCAGLGREQERFQVFSYCRRRSGGGVKEIFVFAMEWDRCELEASMCPNCKI